MQPTIQGRRDVSAGNGRFARKLADWAPGGVDLHVPDAGAATQRRIEGRLQARFPDQGSRHQRRGGCLEIGIARLADITYAVGRDAPRRVEATLRGHDADSRSSAKGRLGTGGVSTGKSRW